MRDFQPSNPNTRNYRHGHKPAGGISPEYTSWLGMRARCTNPKNPNYPRYGGRGIKVCGRWRHFLPFMDDMGPKPTPKHSIERIDNAGDYEPANCRWATQQEQANNRRSSRLIGYGGESKTLAEWARTVALRLSTLHARLESGWTMERALKQPLRLSVRKDEQAPLKRARVYTEFPF